MSDLVTPILGLTKPTVGADLDVWGGITNANWDIVDKSPGLHNVGRNYVHNPLFNIAQRGAGPFTGNGVYGLDRFYQAILNGSQSVSQITLTDADRTSIGDQAAAFALQSVVVGGAPTGSYTMVQHGIENVRRLSGATVTVSFWARATAGTPKIGLNLAQWFGTGGSPSATVQTAGVAVTISTTWTRYTITETLASIAGKVLGTNNDHTTALQFWFSAGTANNAGSGSIGVQSGTFQLWGVQCELGSPATPLEKPDPQQDWARCLRFFYASTAASALGLSWTGYNTNPSAGNYISQPFPTMMRASPTITVTNQVLTNLGAPTYVGCIDGLFVGVQVVAAGAGVLTCNFTASAEL
jgi:hypothetical protein